jgi:hypothetical protein
MRLLSLFLACQHLNSGTNLVSARIRACSGFKRFLCFVLIDVRCFRVLRKRVFAYPPVVRVAQVEDQWNRRLLVWNLTNVQCWTWHICKRTPNVAPACDQYLKTLGCILYPEAGFEVFCWVQWLKLALSNGPHWADVSKHPMTEPDAPCGTMCCVRNTSGRTDSRIPVILTGRCLLLIWIFTYSTL